MNVKHFCNNELHKKQWLEIAKFVTIFGCVLFVRTCMLDIDNYHIK